MKSNYSKFKKEISNLVLEGDLLRIRLALDLDVFDEESKKRWEHEKIDLPIFKSTYERWYTLSMQVIKQVLPDRLDDFVKLYKDEKRKDISDLTYGMSDYMIGLKITRGLATIVDVSVAYPKFVQQLNILNSVEGRLESTVYDMLEIVKADLFDDELEAATELAKKGFLRASGVLAGVVLERHLADLCNKHNCKTRKKNPTINDYNELLKSASVIDIPTWRQIQRFGDIRNYCGHNKERDPTKAEVQELIDGVSKLTKTLF